MEGPEGRWIAGSRVIQLAEVLRLLHWDNRPFLEACDTVTFRDSAIRFLRDKVPTSWDELMSCA